MSPLLEKAAYGAFALLFGLLTKALHKRIRPWIKTREEMGLDKAKVRRQTAKYFSAFFLACSAVSALLLVLAVTLPQASPETPIVRALAGASAGLSIILALILVVGLPVYNDFVDLVERSQSLEERYPVIDHRIQILEFRCRNLEDRNRKLEEEIKSIALGQAQNRLLEEKIPEQGNLFYMDKWALQKRNQNPT
jgi:hypothetical protein